MDFLRQLKDALFIDSTLMILVLILPEQPYKILISLLLELVNCCIYPFLIVRVKNGQKQIHEHEKTNDEVSDEKDGVSTILGIRRQHDIRVVRGRQKHEHVEE